MGRPTRAKPCACVYRSLSVLARSQTCRAETSEKQRRMLAVHKMSEPAVGIIRDSYRESNLSPGAGACCAADDTSGSTRPCDRLQADRQAAKSTAALSGPYFSTMCTVYMPVSVCFLSGWGLHVDEEFSNDAFIFRRAQEDSVGVACIVSVTLRLRICHQDLFFFFYLIQTRTAAMFRLRCDGLLQMK